MRRLVVNDVRNTLGEITMWDRLCEWFDAEFIGGDFSTLAEVASEAAVGASLIVRNCTWFPPIQTEVPTIALLQDIIAEGPARKMQESIIATSRLVVFNSRFTASHYNTMGAPVIPLSVDFSVFTPQNAIACQQALSLPDNCICWIGASQGAAGHIKGLDVFLKLARLNPDLHFVAVFKDAIPASFPPNMRCYARLPQEDLVKVIGACSVGLCTSRMESQHLAGIEMGACGLPLVVPPVGTYWKRETMRGHIVQDGTYAGSIRTMLAMKHDSEDIRRYWQKEFDIPVVRSEWKKLVEEVECSGAS